MGTPPILSPMSPNWWNIAFEPYALEIGFLLREWNSLQDKLRSLFATLLHNPNTDIANSIWYAIPNDRHQRQTIRHLASYLFNPRDSFFPHDSKTRSKITPYEEQMWGEILWIIDSADSLGASRDAAAHSPIAFLVGHPGEFVAMDIFGNPQAKTLKGKKLLSTLRLYRDRAAVIQKHASSMEQVIDRYHRHSQFPILQLLTLPERPPWPSPQEKNKGEDQNRKGRAKAQPRPPQSSQT